jgi:Holliday junction resolvase-like predicted endonuclease
VPLVVYYCDDCGYVELYAAQKTSYWSEEKFGGTSAERAERFEELVAETLRTQLSPFGVGTVSERVKTSYQGRTSEIDIVVETNKGIFVIEVKAKASRATLRSAAYQVVEAANTYYLARTGETDVPIFPVIVIPAEISVPDDYIVGNIPVLRFDSERKIFTNSEDVIKQLKTQHGFRVL